MGFWKTLFQVCSGFDVFLRLLECRFWKAFFHFLGLILLLSFLLAWGHSCLLRPKIDSITGRLFKEIGSLRFSGSEGIRTAVNPDVKQSYILDDFLRFDYYPGKTLTESDTKNWTTPFGVIVMDNGLVVWSENYADSGRGKYLAAPLLMEQNPMKAESIQTGLSSNALYEYLKTNLEHRSGRKVHSILPDADEKLVRDYLFSCLGLLLFFGGLFSCLLLSGMTILFFLLMQLVFFAGSERRPNFRQVLVILIYTAFPALVIASLYSFFMIRLVSPQTVFFIVYFIYYIAIFRKIRLFLNPPREPDFGDDDL